MGYVLDGVLVSISIHAPRTGSDIPSSADHMALDKFQSTLPARGATICTLTTANCNVFQSTLPARGATMNQPRLVVYSPHFNPRSPHGERQ